LDPNSTSYTGKASTSKFISDLKSRLKRAYELADKQAERSAIRMKRQYDKKPTTSDIRPGDKVLLRNLVPKGKLDNAWEENVYIVIDRPNEDLPVYRVKRDDGQGRVKTMHRNHLLICPFSSPDPASTSTDGPDEPDKPTTPAIRRSKRQRRKPSRFAGADWVPH